MSNPEAELEEGQASNQETELTEDDILKRLEPKGEEEQEQEEGGQEGQEDDPKDDKQEKPAEDPLDAWLGNKRKVTVQGEELEITADEAFKGYMRQQDYTRKTTEAAELTKQATQERQFVQQEYAQRITQLDNLSAALYQELVGNQAELAKLIESDPQEYLRQQQRMSQKAAMLNQVDQQRQAIDQIRKNEEEKVFHESVKVNEAKLLDALPDWRDSTKRGAEQREIAQHLISLGYSPDELNSLTDHRAVLIARKAMLWDRAQAVKSKQAQEVKTPPKAIKPGTANSPTNAKQQQVQQLAQRAKRTGRDDDVLALLMARSDRGQS